MAEPVRTCIGCRRAASKRKLVRLARRPDGHVVIDAANRETGRGAYLCPASECLEIALKRGTLSRAFRAPARIGPEVLELFQRRAGSAARG